MNMLNNNFRGGIPRTMQKTVVRAAAAASSAGSGPRIILADDWTTITRPAPTVNTGVQAATLIAQSDLDLDYDGTTNASKIIIHLSEPYSYVTADYAYFIAGMIKSEIQMAATFTDVATATSSLYWRFRPIIADFVCSAQNWNNFGSLTLGTTKEGYYTFPVSASAAKISAFQYTSGPNQMLFGMDLSAGSPYTIYGMAIDCKCAAGLAGIAVTAKISAIQTTNFLGSPAVIVN